MGNQIDTQEVNRRADLLTLASSTTTLKRAAGTGGGEWKGPCPFCGGKDRFALEPNHQPEPRWLCRNCTDGKWKDPIEFGKRLWPGLKFPEICERLAGGQLPTGPARTFTPPPQPAAAPPDEEWQAAALAFVEACERELWAPGGARALFYLHKRGLTDKTIKRFRLGFHPRDEKINGHYTDRGITIPCFNRGKIWYVKICRHNNEPKYRNLKGSQEGIFNAEMLEMQPPEGGAALFCEGEFDCMLAWQELGDLLPVATLGAAGNKPDLAAWGRYFLGQRVTLVCYDLDGPGQKGAETIIEMSRFAVLAPLPDGGTWKDISDFHQAGGDLRAWIGKLLDFHDPLPDLGDFPLLSTTLAYGAVLVEGDSCGFEE